MWKKSPNQVGENTLVALWVSSRSRYNQTNTFSFEIILKNDILGINSEGMSFLISSPFWTHLTQNP